MKVAIKWMDANECVGNCEVGYFEAVRILKAETAIEESAIALLLCRMCSERDAAMETADGCYVLIIHKVEE